MLCPTSYCKNELVIKKSRFLAECFPLNDVSKVRQVIKAKKEEYKTARHVVHSFIIGKDGEHQGSSDDGEPKGTAGHPSLAVLNGSNVTNILVTITRWFGGILLGTGGLVRAYKESTKCLIEVAELKEEKCEENLSIRCDYHESQIVKTTLEKEGAIITNSSYGEDVLYSFRILEELKSPLLAHLRDNLKRTINILSTLHK